MKLLTKEMKKLPKGNESPEKDIKEVVVKFKFFCPWNSWTWYPVEYYRDDVFFGLVDGDYTELGSFSIDEMESIEGPFGMKIERDLYFKPTKIKDLKLQGIGREYFLNG